MTAGALPAPIWVPPWAAVHFKGCSCSGVYFSMGCCLLRCVPAARLSSVCLPQLGHLFLFLLLSSASPAPRGSCRGTLHSSDLSSFGRWGVCFACCESGFNQCRAVPDRLFHRSHLQVPLHACRLFPIHPPCAIALVFVVALLADSQRDWEKLAFPAFPA